jgi:hypothetical protein
MLLFYKQCFLVAVRAHVYVKIQGEYKLSKDFVTQSFAFRFVTGYVCIFLDQIISLTQTLNLPKVFRRQYWFLCHETLFWDFHINHTLLFIQALPVIFLLLSQFQIGALSRRC